MEDLGLSFDNILGDDEVSSLLFEDVGEETPDNEEHQEEKEEKENKEEKDITEVDPENMFEESPESVGNEEKEDKQGKQEETTQKGGTSPSNFFSSIATAFVEEGLFPDLDDETIGKIKTAQDLSDAIREQMNAELTEQQQRVTEVLNNGGNPNAIRYYEDMLQRIADIEKVIDTEGEEYDNLRKQVIIQDYVNKGFKKERAEAKVNKLFEEGGELDEAKESLQSLKSFYSEGYNNYRNKLKEEAEQEALEEKQKAERIKKYILEEKKAFGDLEINKQLRQKAFESISKPVHKDTETGRVFTAIQKYELEHPDEFMAKLGLLYALTDGFTTLDNVIKTKVKKETNKGFAELEKKLNNTARNFDGSLNFASGVSDDNAYIGKGIKLDL